MNLNKNFISSMSSFIFVDLNNKNDKKIWQLSVKKANVEKKKLRACKIFNELFISGKKKSNILLSIR